MPTKTKKCPYALGKCTATSEDQCGKKRMKRTLSAICFKLPVTE